MNEKNCFTRGTHIHQNRRNMQSAACVDTNWWPRVLKLDLLYLSVDKSVKYNVGLTKNPYGKVRNYRMHHLRKHGGEIMGLSLYSM